MKLWPMTYSIITVNYNNYEGLRRTIKSVVCQTYKDYEYIIIDGGSTDGSAELIRQYTDHLTFWVSEPDKGIYNAMNKGVAHANGEYLNFMNSGDCFYDENVLQTLKAHLDSDIVEGQVFDQSTNRFSYKSTSNPTKPVLFKENYYNRHLTTSNCTWQQTGSFLLQK